MEETKRVPISDKTLERIFREIPENSWSENRENLLKELQGNCMRFTDAIKKKTETFLYARRNPAWGNLKVFSKKKIQKITRNNSMRWPKSSPAEAYDGKREVFF